LIEHPSIRVLSSRWQLESGAVRCSLKRHPHAHIPIVEGEDHPAAWFQNTVTLSENPKEHVFIVLAGLLGRKAGVAGLNGFIAIVDYAIDPQYLIQPDDPETGKFCILNVATEGRIGDYYIYGTVWYREVMRGTTQEHTSCIPFREFLEIVSQYAEITNLSV